MAHLHRALKALACAFLAVCLLAGAWFLYFWYTPPSRLPRLSGAVQRRSVTVAGLGRTYLFYAPAGLKPGAPLLIALHGSRQDAAGLRQVSGYAFDRLAEQHSFVVAYPDGYRRTWNDCRKATNYLPARRFNVDDYGFLRTIGSELRRECAIDPKRVFLTGLSNGGHLSFRMALEHPDDFAGFAPVAASLPAPDNSVCRPVGRAVPMMIVHGTDDPICPYEGGELSFSVLIPPQGNFLSSEASARYFAALGGSAESPSAERLPRTDPSDATWVERRTWISPLGHSVVLLSVHGGGHVLPQPYARYPRLLGRQTRNLDAPLEICRFFGLLSSGR